MPYWFDGNSLIGQSAMQSRRDRATRRAFLEQLSRLSRNRGGRFIVFFDGDDPDRSAPPPSVQVRYSSPLSADNAILKRLDEARLPSEVIVVTNDQPLARRSRDRGARVMDWGGFLSRVQKATARRPEKLEPDKDNADMEEWVRYFGLDKHTLK